MALICKDCASGYALPGEPKGAIKNGVYFYSASGREARTLQVEGQQKNAVVLLTDIFGLPLKNSKILADSFADRLKCDVFVPDLFNGNPPLTESDLAPYIVDVPGQKLQLFETIKFIMCWIRGLPSIVMNRPTVGLARAEKCINDAKNMGHSKIGVVGYCYGGGVSIHVATKKGLADAVVSCHPGPVNVDDMARLVTPFAVMCADDDIWVPPAKRDQLEAALNSNTGVKTKLVNFPGEIAYMLSCDCFLRFMIDLSNWTPPPIKTKGTVHGFAARPNLGIPKVRESFEGAFESTVAWMEKYLS